MGKKDDEIKLLKEELSESRSLNNNLHKQIDGQANGYLADTQKMKQSFVEEKKSLQQTYDHSVKAMQAEVQKIQDHKETLILNVQIAGGEEDLTKLLNDSSAMLKARLETLGIADRYDILSIPSTFHIGSLR